MDDLNAVTLELLRMFSGRAFHNSGPDFANALSPYPFAVRLLSNSSSLSDLKHIDVPTKQSVSTKQSVGKCKQINF